MGTTTHMEGEVGRCYRAAHQQKSNPGSSSTLRLKGSKDTLVLPELLLSFSFKETYM